MRITIKNILLPIVSCMLAVGLQAQNEVFDPMLDPSCKILPTEQLEEWSSSYMWYPGQLSAHMQRQLKKESEIRCTYVGYPGKFNKDVYQSYFRKKIKISKDTPMKWDGSETITFYINGQKQESSLREYTLKPGMNTVLFEIRSGNRFPCLIVKGEGIEALKDWQVSLDNVNWNIPETYKTYNNPAKLPDEKQEIDIEIRPYEFIPLINTSIEKGELILGKNGCSIVDFRHLEVGTLKLNVTGKGKLSFNVGESPEEVLNENEKDFEQRSLPPVKLTGISQQITLPERALRYLKIKSDDECTIHSINLDAIVWPVDYLMQFECSDESFNRMWKAASATLHTSMHHFYLDGVKRDYLPWAMDAIESSFAGDYLFGDEQVSRNGLSIALTPPDPQVLDFGIIDYPLHALVGFKHNYLRYGDIRTSLMYKDRIIQMLDLYESIQDENGFISAENSTSGFIPGWATKMGPGGKGVASYGQIMLYHNYMLGAYFARLWKENSLAGKYQKKGEFLKQSIMKHFWDDDQKAFINGYYENGEKDVRISHHAQYWGILADIFPSDHYDNLFNQILPQLKFYKEDISYEKGYEFMAYIKAGKLEDAVSFLDAVWGDWLNQGHTRFPENFSPISSRKEQLVFYGRPFGLSLCHGGNGVAPVVIALNGILGFRQSDKNISEYYLEPQLLNLDWVKGKIPIKEGFIHISVDKAGKSIIEIPENCIVHLCKSNVSKPIQTMKKAGKYECNL